MSKNKERKIPKSKNVAISSKKHEAKNTSVNSKDSQKKAETSSSTGDLDELSDQPFRSTYILLAVIGALPVTWKRHHQPSLHPMRSTLPYAILVFIAVLFSALNLLYPLTLRIINEDMPLQDRMLKIEVVTLHFYSLTLPALWSDVPAAFRCTESLREIMKMYRKITGRPLRLYRKREKMANVVTLAMAPSYFYLIKECLPEIEFDVFSIPSFFITLIVIVSLCTLWVGLYSTMEHVAKNVNVHFQMDLRQNLLTTCKTQIYRKLRLEVRSLMDATNRFSAPLVIFIIFLVGVVSLFYQSVVLLPKGFILSGVVHLGLAMLHLIIIYVIARAGHNATEQIKRLNSCILAKEEISSLREDTQREVIGMYLADNLRPPVQTFSGFVSVDKGLITSVLAIIATNLVMVYQVTTGVKQDI